MKVAFIVHDVGINALGRAYSLSLLVEELGWEFRVVGFSSTGSVWEVLDHTPFGDRCEVIDSPAGVCDVLRWADVAVAVKLLPRSFGIVAHCTRSHGPPVVLDIDDPDFEMHLANVAHLARQAPVEAVKRVRGLLRTYWSSRGVPRLTSNPALQSRWGGALVPHARPVREPAPPPSGEVVRVGFVGTVRRHKGIDVLRAAVADLEADGYRLVVTATAPADAHPWEDWSGTGSLARGTAILDSCHLLAVPSVRMRYAPLQFPVKLIDAMLAARPVVASDLPPIRWALGGTGQLCVPGSVADLRSALRRFRDPRVRLAAGLAGRERALDMFTAPSIAPAFRSALEAAVTAAGR